MPRSVGNASAHAGDREFKITIEKLSESTAGSGFPTEAFGQPMQVWASREYVSLQEGVRADQLSASAVMRWTIPYHFELDPDRYNIPKTRRIVYHGRTYDIQTAEMQSRQEGRAIVLTTLAKVD